MTLTAALGWLSQSPLTDVTVTEYDSPHGKPEIEQVVLVELQDRNVPSLVTAFTRKDCASGLVDHEMAIELAEQFTTTFTA